MCMDVHGFHQQTTVLPLRFNMFEPVQVRAETNRWTVLWLNPQQVKVFHCPTQLIPEGKGKERNISYSVTLGPCIHRQTSFVVSGFWLRILPSERVW